MGQVLSITSGTVDPSRAEEFQVAFQTIASERMARSPFAKQVMLVHRGGGVWTVHSLLDSRLAFNTKPVSDVPGPVQLFRDFGTEPTTEVADVSCVLSQVASTSAET